MEAGDSHDGHDHRRLLDHSGHDHADHDHGSETESTQDVTPGDGHSAHDDGEAAASTYLDASSVAALTVAGETGAWSCRDGQQLFRFTTRPGAVRILPSLSGSRQCSSFCAEQETVERALAFITACQIDAGCGLGDPAQVEPGADRSSRAHFGLKVGLAMTFIAMTVIASWVPTLLMRLPVYNVRHHVTACTFLPCVHLLNMRSLAFLSSVVAL